MKTAKDLAELLKKTELNFITGSDLWNNDPTLTKAKAWLVNPVAPHVDELDTFYKETIQPLVQFFATCKLVDKLGRTPLMCAARYGCTESVKALVGAPGIDVNAKDTNGWTALMFAAQRVHSESVKALLGVPGIDVNAKNKDDGTALMYAPRYGYTESVKALVGAPGVDVNAKNKYGETPLIGAAQRDHTECANLIREHLRLLEAEPETGSRNKRAIL